MLLTHCERERNPVKNETSCKQKLPVFPLVEASSKLGSTSLDCKQAQIASVRATKLGISRTVSVDAELDKRAGRICVSSGGQL